ncbi:YifB family Mg chelatase-like AAA ATPase [Candidatus Parcubacteria bacterium]|nr:YifB family Mg chelatase-like AAA ATPase [Candidatus Parcubacteria bacterium]
MSFAKVFSAQTSLLKAHIIDVEVDLAKGLHSFTIVGLPDKAVEEARDRVSAAIKNSGFPSPKSKNQKITVSLAPADLKKEGPLFDLGVALAYLLASGEIKFDPEGKLFVGELSLDGNVRSVAGVLALTKAAKENGFGEIFVPKDNAREAALIDGIKVFGVGSLSEVIDHLYPTKKVGEQKKILASEKTTITFKPPIHTTDFSEIKGQETAKRGLEIAAAGKHNIAMFGPPGTGKTMLAQAFTNILPPLSFDEALETTAIHSIAGALSENVQTNPPFRAPHHTSSYVSLIGGGTFPKPGEITLAHRGVLFLDEFPEFDRRVIDALRQPLEERRVSISRAKGSASFPAHFILVAAMNPCPCGNFGIAGKDCTCSPVNILRYQRKISGPIIDRIDMWVEVSLVNYRELATDSSDVSESDEIRSRIEAARARQRERFTQLKLPFETNSDMKARNIHKISRLTPDALELLTVSAPKLDLSARAYHRVIKLSRTIADLDDSEDITQKHLLEALQYRPKKLS